MERFPSNRTPERKRKTPIGGREALRALLVGYGLVAGAPAPATELPHQAAIENSDVDGAQLDKTSREEKLTITLAETLQRSTLHTMEELKVSADAAHTPRSELHDSSLVPVIEYPADVVSRVVDAVLKDRTFVRYDPDCVLGAYRTWSGADRAADLLFNATSSVVASAPEERVADVLHMAQRVLPPERFETLLDRVSPKATVETALLAFNREPHSGRDPNELLSHEYLIDADRALQHVGDVPEKLVTPLVKHTAMAGTLQSELNDAFSFQDPKRSEARAALMTRISEENNFLNPIELEQSRAFVARNLYLQGHTGKFTAEMVTKEVDAIRARRAELGSEQLFAHRVVLVSNNELEKEANGLMKPGDPRFGTRAFADELAALQLKQSGSENGSFRHITPLSFETSSSPHMSLDSITAARTAAIAEIEDGSQQTTIIFDGHASDEGIYLTDGKVEADGEIHASKSGEISVDDMVMALEKRWETQLHAHPHAKELNISLIFDSCFSQDYLRSIAEELAAHNVPLPHLMISASEYGQYAWSNPGNKYGALFNELMVNFPTISGILHNKGSIVVSTPSIFVPRKANPTVPMQLGGIVVPSNTAIG